MSNYRNRIGEAIAFARNVAGRSQQELADMLGRDKRTIEMGAGRDPHCAGGFSGCIRYSAPAGGAL